MDPLILAGYSEEDAAALSDAAAAAGITLECLASALSGFTENCANLGDALRELDALARTTQELSGCAGGKRKIPPRSLNNMKSTAARPPARPARYPTQRGRKR